MKIAVLIKQVPDTAANIKLNADKTGIDETSVKWVVNPYDEFAIEAALQIKEQGGDPEVIVFSAGPARSDEAIRTALAMGADRAIRINTDGKTDPLTTSRLLAAAIKAENCELVLGGKQAVDGDAAQVIQGVAEVLGVAVVSVVEKLSFKDGTVSVHRPVSGGIKELIEVKLPVVLGCDKGLNSPRYPSLPGIMKAKKKTLDVKEPADLGVEVKPMLIYGEYSMPPERESGKKIEGEPAEVASQLVAWLKQEVKII